MYIIIHFFVVRVLVIMTNYVKRYIFQFKEGSLSESENDSEHEESSNDLEEEVEELGVVVTMEMVSKWNEQLKEVSDGL